MDVTLIELDREKPRKISFRLKEHWNDKVNRNNLDRLIQRSGFSSLTEGNFKVEIRHRAVRNEVE